MKNDGHVRGGGGGVPAGQFTLKQAVNTFAKGGVDIIDEMLRFMSWDV
jgi:hypothetical protein